MPSVTVQQVEPLNYNVRRFKVEKPEGYTFIPGQATLVSIDQEGLRDQKRPFTFTSLPDEGHLEFTIKIYPSHEGVTDKLDDIKPGDRLLIEDAWGAIQFQGKGTFIAGGAGLTPMLAILRDQAIQQSDAVEQLIFSNKTAKDLFLEKELRAATDDKLLLTYTQEHVDGAEHGRVNATFLRKHLKSVDQFFYVCGPPGMVESVEALLKQHGAQPEKIITEES